MDKLRTGLAAFASLLILAVWVSRAPTTTAQIGGGNGLIVQQSTAANFNATARVTGNAGAVFDAATNATPSANNVAISQVAQSSGGNPTAASSGNTNTFFGDLTGNQYVRTGGPNQITCYARGVAAALADFTQIAGSTGCGSTAGAGLKIYVTDITAQSTTTTGGTFRLSYGTGAACATTNNALFPGNTSDTFSYPANNSVNPFQITFNQPLVAAAGSRLCAFGTATNTLNISVNGFVAP